MIVDLIRSRYRGTMRAWDGSLFDVDWAFVEDPAAEVLPFVHPFVSARDEPLGHFDLGYVGEIPATYAPESKQVVPDTVCSNCWVGLPTWWESGWPAMTPPVVLGPDGWPVLCTVPPMPVSSVGLSAPIEYVVSGSPVTSTGVLTFRWVDEPANTVLAAPDGSAGQPSFRLLTSGDLPASLQGIINTVSWYQSGPPAGPGLPTIGAYTLQDGETIYVDSPIGSVSAGPWTVHTGAWTRPTWFANGASFTGFFIVNVLSTRSEIEGSGQPSLFRLSKNVIGDVYSPWVVGTDVLKTAALGTGGVSVVGGPGISTTPSVPVPTNLPGSVTVSFDGTSPVDQISFTPTSVPSTDNTVYVDSTTFNLTFVNNAGVPLNVLVGGGAGLGISWIPYVVNGTAMAVAGRFATFTFANLPPGSVVMGFATQCTATWSVANAVIDSLEMDNSQDGGLTWGIEGPFLGLTINTQLDTGTFGNLFTAGPLWTTTPYLWRLLLATTLAPGPLVVTGGQTTVWLCVAKFR